MKRHEHRGKFSQGLLGNELILKVLDVKAGQRIVDAGCGNGYMAKMFSREVSGSGKVYALDSDKQQIEILRNETQGTNIETMVGDITESIQLGESSIDLIYVSTVIHGFSNNQIKGLIQEVRRLLKPDATLATAHRVIARVGKEEGTIRLEVQLTSLIWLSCTVCMERFEPWHGFFRLATNGNSCTSFRCRTSRDRCDRDGGLVLAYPEESQKSARLFPLSVKGIILIVSTSN